MENILAVVLLVLVAVLTGTAETIKSKKRRAKKEPTALLGVVAPKRNKNDEF